ncbi:MAG: AAA family ATPase [Fuscovulum sp.]|nr:MAG: AAA family ATPase [Fuscovulum sp.]
MTGPTFREGQRRINNGFRQIFWGGDWLTQDEADPVTDPIWLAEGSRTAQPPSVIIPNPPLRPFDGWQLIDPAKIPRVPFVYGDHYAAGFITQTIAPPKLGKSLLGMAEAIDMATGRGAIWGRPGEPAPVLYYNAEDTRPILDARSVAVAKHMGVDQRELVGRYVLASGLEPGRNLILMAGETATINEDAFRFLEDEITRLGIRLAIFDPLQDLSESPETNEAFRTLGKRLRKLAADTDTALGIIHHTRKAVQGVAASMDDGRGGSALRGVARFNRLLVPMSEAEGAQSGVEDFRNYFRVAEAESNLAPPSSDRNRWFEKIGVEIGNGGTYPAIRPWSWPEAFAGVKVDDARRVRAILADRAARDAPARENSQAADWAGHIVADVLRLDLSKASDLARIKTMLSKWIDTGVLAVEHIRNSKGKDVPHVFPGPNDPGEVE